MHNYIVLFLCSILAVVATTQNAHAQLQKKVLGFHPYWVGTAYKSYDTKALTHIAFFSAEIDTATATAKFPYKSRADQLIEFAKPKGLKILLTVTNFGYTENDVILRDTAKHNSVIASIVALVKASKFDGVCIDFESVRATQRKNLVAFMQTLRNELRKVQSKSELMIATPAVDWSNTFDLQQLSVICTDIMLMAYDYYWKGSQIAGPCAPLRGESYSVSMSVQTYLLKGVPKEKLLMGVPWYGYVWATMGSGRKSYVDTNRSDGLSITYDKAEQMAQTYDKEYDTITRSVMMSYKDSTGWYQAWYDDSTSLGEKYSYVNTTDIAGIGIWALGYQGNSPTLFNGIKQAFAQNTTQTEDVIVAEENTPVITIAPNPCNDYVYVYIPTVRGSVKITIGSSNGAVLSAITHNTADGALLINTRSLNMSTGIYHCIVQYKGKAYHKQFAIER